jgi:hypothetical protein
MDFFNKSPKAEKIAQDLMRKEVTPLVTTQQTEKTSHVHQWEMLSKTQAPPRQDVTNITSDKEILDKMLFGVTVFLWECLLCHELRKESVLGSDVTQLDELIDKADRYGPQYIQRTDGQTFAVIKYTQQTTGPLPMR